MAHLEAELKNSWKAALKTAASPWIAFGLNGRTLSRAERLCGMAGLIDWYVHGQVSKLLLGDRLTEEEFCLIPATSAKPNFLLYQHGDSPSTSAFLNRVRQLNISEICLAESTFPKDFLVKMKQTLKKEGIHCTRLEPKEAPEEPDS